MRQYIIDKASSGKTRELLEYAKNIGAVVVCQNPEAMRVKAQNYGLFRMEFYGYNEIEDLPDDTMVVVDELCHFFKQRFNSKLEGFNLTVD